MFKENEGVLGWVPNNGWEMNQVLTRRGAGIEWEETVTVQPAVAAYFDFHVFGLTWLSHTIITVAFYNCLLQTAQWKGLPRANVFFFQPSFTPPSIGNEALQLGLVSAR